jgi:FAD-dependent oxidoreductase domain-containing protein 1
MAVQPHIVIIGGGVMGAATAYFLAQQQGIAATVIERDPHYTQASSALSASSIRQQFSSPVNIALSRWSFDFLQRAATELSVGTDAPHLSLVTQGYLYLATPLGQPTLVANHAKQVAQGADIQWLPRPALAQRFAWLHTDDLACGTWGASGEGWFDGPALHHAFKRKAQALGARWRVGEVARIHTHGHRAHALQLADGGTLEGIDALALCAGAWSAPLAAQLGLHIPVSAKKRDVFVFDSPAATPNCPLVIDPSGLWFRPEGRGWLCGGPPRTLTGHPALDDPDDAPLHAIDHALWDDTLWPALAHRVPAFEAARVRSAWAGYYEMNAWDHNGLAGPIPGTDNAFTACGFSGHGMQQAPAVGHAVARLIVGKPAPEIADLSPARIAAGVRVVEANVI